MDKKWQVEKDAKIIDKTMMNYSGMEGCHFGYIAYASGERHFFMGGRCDISGYCLSEALANMVSITPALGEEFIDMVCACAKDLLKDSGGEKVQ